MENQKFVYLELELLKSNKVKNALNMSIPLLTKLLIYCSVRPTSHSVPNYYALRILWLALCDELANKSCTIGRE